MEATNRIYDFIVRYHRSDLEMVAYIVSDLNRRGFHPWFDRWSIIRGVEPSRQLDSGISSSRSVVFFVGDRYPAPSEEPGLPGHHVRSLSEDGLPVTLVLLPGAKKHVNYQPTFVKDAFCIDFQDDFKARDKIKELSDRLQSVSRTDTDIPQIAFARENSSGQYPFTSELTNINITVYNSIAEKFAGIWANHPPQQILELLNK